MIIQNSLFIKCSLCPKTCLCFSKLWETFLFFFFFHFLRLKAMSVEAQTILGPIQTVQDSLRVNNHHLRWPTSPEGGSKQFSLLLRNGLLNLVRLSFILQRVWPAAVLLCTQTFAQRDVVSDGEQEEKGMRNKKQNNVFWGCLFIVRTVEPVHAGLGLTVHLLDWIVQTMNFYKVWTTDTYYVN